MYAWRIVICRFRIDDLHLTLAESPGHLPVQQ